MMLSFCKEISDDVEGYDEVLYLNTTSFFGVIWYLAKLRKQMARAKMMCTRTCGHRSMQGHDLCNALLPVAANHIGTLIDPRHLLRGQGL